jgi:hypothetical protein
MAQIRVAMTVDDETREALNRQSEADGFYGIAPVVRRFVMLGVRKSKSDEGDLKTIEIPVDNFQELSGYVQEKKLWSVPAFAVSAMAAEMRKHPLTPAQKARVEKSIGE